jgi:para-nitrobenzyl esterase
MIPKYDSGSIDRRSLITTAMKAAIQTAAGFGATAGLAAKASPAFIRSRIIASASNAVVETQSGKVRGYTCNGINAFKGIPYASSMARFSPPAKAEPWSGIRSSMNYGPVCPQVPRADWGEDEEAWLYSWDDGVQSEDCLRINIWTPGITPGITPGNNDNRKRPVMLWLHGGGFTAGSSQELKAYDGERLSRRGDVVVASVNHRLGALGFLNLTGYTPNVGLLDLVAALEWIRDNISGFGGDAANVTIFGQSGGGGKVGALMAMPRAKGLFHRAAIQSGSIMRFATPEESAQLTAATLHELGLENSQTEELKNIPAASIVDAANRANQRLLPEMNPAQVWDRIGWEPVVDGAILPSHPFDPAAPLCSATVPLLVGTVLNEFVTGIDNPKLDSLTEDILREFAAKFGDPDRIIAAFRRANPRARPSDLVSLISATPLRRNAVRQAELKAAQGAAPAYLYLFAWQTPILDGRPRAFHGSELPFVFDNVDRCENMTGGGPEAHDLAARVSQAWINFAHTGNPNHHNLPKWPAYTAAQAPTMVFDNQCKVENNPDREELFTTASNS